MEVVSNTEPSDKERVTEFRAHSLSANCCQLFHHDQRLATSSDDKTLAIWDTVTGKKLSSIVAHDHSVVSCSVVESTNKLLSAGWDKFVHMWDIETGTKLWSFGYNTLVTSCCLSNNIAIATVDKTVHLHDAVDGRLINTITGHANTVTSCTISSRGSELCSSSMDKTAKVWDVRMLQALLILKGHINIVSCCCFSHDAHYVATASWDKTLQLYDIATGVYRSEGPVVLKNHEGSISSCSFSKDGSLLVSGGYDLNVNIYGTSNNKLKLGLKGHEGWVNWVCTGEDRKWIASCSKDGMVRVWNTEVETNQYTKHKKKDLGIDMARCFKCGRLFAVNEEPTEHMQCVFCRMSNPSRTFMDQLRTT